MSLANLNRFQSALDRSVGILITGLGLIVSASIVFVGA
jgi:hypothetical protein